MKSMFDTLVDFQKDNHMTANQMKTSLKSLIDAFDEMDKQEKEEIQKNNYCDGTTFAEYFHDIYCKNDINDNITLENLIELMYRWYCTHTGKDRAKNLTLIEHKVNLDSIKDILEVTLDTCMNPIGTKEFKINLDKDINKLLDTLFRLK